MYIAVLGNLGVKGFYEILYDVPRLIYRYIASRGFLASHLGHLLRERNAPITAILDKDAS